MHKIKAGYKVNESLLIITDNLTIMMELILFMIQIFGLYIIKYANRPFR